MFVVLGVVLYFIHPFAPVLLAASILIQLPLVWILTSSSYNSAYRERSEQNRQKYMKSRDAGHWLEQEDKEASSFGYRFLNQAAKQQNAIIRAELLLQLGRRDEAQTLINSIGNAKINPKLASRYEELHSMLEQTEE